MKQLILLLLCISIGYACKKNSPEPQQSVQNITIHCDTITCLNADFNGKYEFYDQPDPTDTNMFNHSFRLKLIYTDSIFNAQSNSWVRYHHYQMCNATFNLNIVKPQYITPTWAYYNNGDNFGFSTTTGKNTMWKKVLDYH